MAQTEKEIQTEREIKICPRCKTENESNRTSCKKCDTRLDNVHPIKVASAPEQEPELPTPVPELQLASENSQYWRRCPRCWKTYDISVLECPDCRTEMYVCAAPTARAVYTLRFDDGKTCVCLKDGEKIQIARKDERTSDPLDEYLYERLYVSHQDVSLRCEGKKLYLFRPAPRNPTLVNGKRIENQQEIELKAGDQVTLGNSRQVLSELSASFLVEQKENGI